MLHDKDIREPLFQYLEEIYGRLRIIEEKQIGKSRADVVMVLPDKICGIEIKSDADTYARLERQVKDYNRIFDYNFVAVGSSHGAHVDEHIPDYWGIITVEMDRSSGKLDFYMLRQPKPNPKREKKVKFRNQMDFLWRPELNHILEINKLPKYTYLSKAKLVAKLMEVVPEEELKAQICIELFERDYNTISERIQAYKDEKALKAAGRNISTNKKKTKSRRTSLEALGGNVNNKS